MSNTLLSLTMMLAKGMFMTYQATEDDDEPFEITATFAHPSVALTSTIDDFAERYLKPALNAALERKRPLAEWREFECRSSRADMEVCVNAWGIAGRLVRCYTIDDDALALRIDIRAADGATRREATRLIREEQEARRLRAERRMRPITQERTP